MKISLIDRSFYYKGLMLLIRKDCRIHYKEGNMVMYIGKILGFESEFCENAIEEIMHNKHVIDSPPLFSEPRIALSFLSDGLRLAASDGQLHKTELAWLESVAESNGLGALWAGELEKFYFIRSTESLETSLKLKHFKWEYRRQYGSVATRQKIDVNGLCNRHVGVSSPAFS
jgi:hypothetical protein